jgi:hypothetical protein
VIVRLWSYTVDDTFISLRYAQHLAQGHGLVYNLGQRVEGYTNFLWTVLLALPFVLHIDPIVFIKVVNLALLAGTAFMTARLARLTPLARHPGLVALAAALVLASPAMAISADEGLETMLFTFLLVWTAAAFLEDGSPSRFPRCLPPLVLLALTRPDGVVYAAWLIGAAVAMRRPRGYVVRLAVSFAVLYGAYFFTRAAWYGYWLPNTFYAKGGGDWLQMTSGLPRLRQFAIEYVGVAWVLVPLAFLPRESRGLAVLLLGIAALRFAFHFWSGGPFMGHQRFLLPALPFLYVLVFMGVGALRVKPRMRADVALVAAGLSILGAWLDQAAWEVHYQRYARGLQEAHVALGKSIHEQTAPDAVIAIDDAGAAPFYAERTNIDMLGLNDTHIAHLPGRFYEKYDMPYVLSKQPDLVVLLASRPDPQTGRDMKVPGHITLLADSTFQARHALFATYKFEDDYYLLVFRRLDSRAAAAR